MRARYYDPEVGRFITTDPMTGNPANPQTLNPYAYCLNNPVNLTDPAGLAPVYMHKPGSVQSQITTMFVLCSPVLGYAGVAAAQYVMPIMLGSAPVIHKAVPRAAPVAPVVDKCDDIMGELAKTGKIDPFLVRFSQDSVSSTFSDGRPLWATIDGLRSGLYKAADIPAIRIFWRDGKLYTLDNRRLVAFSQAGVKVAYKLVSEGSKRIAVDIGRKFNPIGDGWIIRIRPGK